MTISLVLKVLAVAAFAIGAIYQKANPTRCISAGIGLWLASELVTA